MNETAFFNEYNKILFEEKWSSEQIWTRGSYEFVLKPSLLQDWLGGGGEQAWSELTVIESAKMHKDRQYYFSASSISYMKVFDDHQSKFIGLLFWCLNCLYNIETILFFIYRGKYTKAYENIIKSTVIGLL